MAVSHIVSLPSAIVVFTCFYCFFGWWRLHLDEHFGRDIRHADVYEQLAPTTCCKTNKKTRSHSPPLSKKRGHGRVRERTKSNMKRTRKKSRKRTRNFSKKRKINYQEEGIWQMNKEEEHGRKHRTRTRKRNKKREPNKGKQINYFTSRDPQHDIVLS